MCVFKFFLVCVYLNLWIITSQPQSYGLVCIDRWGPSAKSVSCLTCNSHCIVVKLLFVFLSVFVFVYNQELAAEKWVVLAVRSPFCQAPSNPPAIMLPFLEGKKLHNLYPAKKRVIVLALSLKFGNTLTRKFSWPNLTETVKTSLFVGKCEFVNVSWIDGFM